MKTTWTNAGLGPVGNKRHKQGFTLIELLVVIAIIALLLSILIPALTKVKEQARLVVCSSNVKQISLMTGLYQAENNNAVPLMINRWATGSIYRWPAKTALLSLALKDYGDGGSTSAWPVYLDPDRWWHTQWIVEYTNDFMPDIFGCPFAKGKRTNWASSASEEYYGEMYQVNEVRERSDSYTPWLRPLKGNFAFFPGHSLGDPYGISQYATSIWHQGFRTGYMHTTQIFSDEAYNELVRKPRKWVNEKNTSRLAVLYCSSGEIDMSFDPSSPQINNPKSHKKGSRGGTNIMLADGTVDWIAGTRMSLYGLMTE